MTDSNSAQILRSFARRDDTLSDEIEERRQDKAELYQEIKSSGLDVKAFRLMQQARRKRGKDPRGFDELQETARLYADAIGDFGAALTRAGANDPATGEIREAAE
jgi:uncharacterized protein (UPF0335 family)